MPIKLLVTADLHLGRTSSAVPKSSEENATKYTWKRLVKYAVDNNIDAVALAGDVVDRDNRFYEAIGPLQEGFEILGEAGIPVVMVSGNHDFDVLPDILKSDKYDHVHLLGKKGRWEQITVQCGEEYIQFLGWSFPKQHINQDPSSAYDVKELDPNLPTVGLLHGDVYDKNSNYAPIELSNLVTSHVDSWIIGHMHKPDILNNNAPLILYPGSPHALSAKESGPHGPNIMTLGDGDSISIEQLALSPVRYETFTIDITGIDDETDFRDRLVGDLTDWVQDQPEEFEHASSVVFDVELNGRHTNLTEFDQWTQFAGEFEQVLLGDTEVSIRKVKNLAEPEVENLEQLAGQPNPPGTIAKMILDLENGEDSEFLNDFMSEFEDSLEKINRNKTYRPLKIREEQELMDLSETKDLLLRECRHLLAELLSQNEQL
ncbi:exonuclease SbcCD subunit D [Halalkalibaculum sp. DA384]|uniref:metallophosphoesterase family protein n=1 Tax=Halalkalibaculum sp. DA384 TaxID=3373606 RepID=UPI0037542BF3